MLRVIFTGLMTIVPSDLPVEEARSACVVVVDARSESMDSDPDVRKPIQPHVPHFRFDQSLLAPNSPLKPRLFRTTTAGVVEAVVMLEGVDVAFVTGEADDEDFEITTGTREPGTSMPCCEGNPAECPAYARCVTTPGHPYLRQKEDFYWVLRPEQGVVDAKKTHDDCYESPLPDDRSVARVSLTRGRLFTHRLDGQTAPDDGVAKNVKRVVFDDGRTDYQAVAREVALEVAVPGETKEVYVVIREPDRADRPPGILVLRWPEGRDAELTVDNAPLHEFLMPGSSHPERYSRRHFEHLYRLVETGIPPNTKLPVPSRMNVAGDLLCPPAHGGP